VEAGRPRVTGVYVGFRLGREAYAIPVEHVLEIATFKDVTRVPGTQPALSGVWNLRGQILTVIDLALVLGVESSGRAKYLLVVEIDGRRAGLAVDEVRDVEYLNVAAEFADSDLLLAAAITDDALVGILDLPQLVEALERGLA
jgi:purine-binding chemotaxis protein CheW